MNTTEERISATEIIEKLYNMQDRQRGGNMKD